MPLTKEETKNIYTISSIEEFNSLFTDSVTLELNKDIEFITPATDPLFNNIAILGTTQDGTEEKYSFTRKNDNNEFHFTYTYDKALTIWKNEKYTKFNLVLLLGNNNKTIQEIARKELKVEENKVTETKVENKPVTKEEVKKETTTSTKVVIEGKNDTTNINSLLMIFDSYKEKCSLKAVYIGDRAIARQNYNLYLVLISKLENVCDNTTKFNFVMDTITEYFIKENKDAFNYFSVTRFLNLWINRDVVDLKDAKLDIHTYEVLFKLLTTPKNDLTDEIKDKLNTELNLSKELVNSLKTYYK